MLARRVAAALAISVCLLGLQVASAAADPGLAGRWNSDSLRDNDIGYFMQLAPVSADEYRGTLRFAYRGDRRGSVTRITVVRSGDSLAIRARSGSFDRAAGVLRARIDGRTITLTNCRDLLRLVMANALDSDCVFRPALGARG